MEKARAPAWQLSEPEAQQVASLLGAPAVEVAFLRAEQGIYFARREPWPPLSPVLRLLCGIHELEPQCARFIARNPVYSTAAASATCIGASRLGARRLRPQVPPCDHGLELPEVPLVDAGAAAPAPRSARSELLDGFSALVARGPERDDDGGWMRLALTLAFAAAEAGPEASSGRTDRPIAALLVSACGELLEWATHMGAHNAMRHAELNLVEAFMVRTRSRLPAGARLYSTLKPCRMCAGLIWDAAQYPATLRVLFAHDDAGRYARETVLDAGSVARQRETPDPADARRVLQWRLDLQ